MTQLDFTLEVVQRMADPCRCEQCGNWVGVSRLRPIEGELQDTFDRQPIRQTIWICVDCLDDER